MAGAGDELKGHLGGANLDPGAICALLDGLEHRERLEAIRSLGRGEQRRLYEGVDRFLPVRLVDLVPPNAEDMAPVRHFGKNTLPAFRIFEKRFCRPEGADPDAPDRLYGFNFQALSWLTGPGYFVARNSAERPEVLIDYHEVPPVAAEGWPAVRSNERALSRFVYGFMVDTLRRVSEHVTVGSASRKGKDMGSWFVLCRESR
jgi:hypothetical protein